MNFKRIFTYAFIMMLLISCSKSNSVRVASDIKIKIPSTAIFKNNFCETHIITIHQKDKNENHHFIAKVEFKDNSLVLVGLTTNYYRLFNITQKNDSISYVSQKSFSFKLKPNLILALFYLAHLHQENRNLLFHKNVTIKSEKEEKFYRSVFSTKKNKLILLESTLDSNNSEIKIEIGNWPVSFTVKKQMETLK